jgi:hypothetical protein
MNLVYINVMSFTETQFIDLVIINLVIIFWPSLRVFTLQCTYHDEEATVLFSLVYP